jgi:uncharacterized SAM-binding protein YcdF (DUF218 family)
LAPVIVSALKALVMPPLSLFVLGAAGLCVHPKRPRLGKTLMFVAAALLVALSLPVVSAALIRGLQSRSALDLEHLPEGPQAIVVLAGDFNAFAPEYGGSTVGMLTLERVRYAALLAHRTALPVLSAGGPPREGFEPLSVAMQRVLESELDTDVRWTERASRTTRENVAHAREILSAEGINRIYLVTHSWHMPRAAKAARAAGFEVIPAPTSFLAWPRARVALVPSAKALRQSSWALHEWIGRAWYALTG